MRLSVREREVLLLLATGHSMLSASRLLHISRNTVNQHSANFRLALGACNLANAVLISMRAGLLA